MKIFCVQCESKTDTKNLEVITIKNKRALKGLCVICGSKKIIFVGEGDTTKCSDKSDYEGGDLVDFISTAQPFEKHLPGHSFTGPSTRLDLRLNPDLTAKDRSLPINRVDEAAYKHNIQYMSKDKDIRTKADEAMIKELQNISNPSFREKIERAIVIPILKTKKFLGLGLAPLDYRNLIFNK